jgi:hypothetical protein
MIGLVTVVTGTSNTDFIGIIALGALALIIFTAVYVKERQVSATFARVFALIVIAVLGVALGFASITSTTQTAGFTLLGTIAGYLAGTKTKTATTSKSTVDANMNVMGIAGSPTAEESKPHTFETYL